MNKKLWILHGILFVIFLLLIKQSVSCRVLVYGKAEAACHCDSLFFEKFPHCTVEVKIGK